MKPLIASLAAALLCLPLAASARENGVGQDVASELAQARKDVRDELAAARAQLDSENLDITHGLHVGRHGNAADDTSLPKAEITRQGDFLIDGKAVTIDSQQRRELLAYRGQVIDMAKTGIDIGERSAQAALDAVDNGLFGLIVSAMSGNLDRRVEAAVKQSIAPALTQFCHTLPALRATQQHLAASLPQFQPYVTLHDDDVADCQQWARDEFAQHQKD